MDLNYASQLASIAGLAISIFTLIRVWDIKREIASQNLSRTIHGLIEEALLFPTQKHKLTGANVRKVAQIIVFLDQVLISKWSLRHYDARKLLKLLRDEMKSECRTQEVITHLTALRSQLFTIN